MPGLVPGIRVLVAGAQAWMAGTSPAMTDYYGVAGEAPCQHAVVDAIMTTRDDVLNSSDAELSRLLFAEINSRLSPGQDDGLDKYLARLEGWPRGVRAMAMTFQLDVSLNVDDLGWHFANWQHKAIATRRSGRCMSLRRRNMPNFLRRLMRSRSHGGTRSATWPPGIPTNSSHGIPDRNSTRRPCLSREGCGSSRKSTTGFSVCGDATRVSIRNVLRRCS